VILAVIACAVFLAAPGAAVAGARAPDEPGRSTVDPTIMQIDEPAHLGAQLDGATKLVDTEGREFSVKDLLGKPVILLLSYYGCDGTCPTMNANLAKVLADVKRFSLGKDYRVLTVSFDRQDTPQTAAEFLKKTAFVPPGLRDGWRHAVLKETDVAAFAGSVGFRFFWSHADKTFLHPNVLVFLTPDGRVARYIYGTRMDPQAIELALTDADWDRIANSTAIFDIASGVCYSFNYTEGRYQPNYSLLIGFGSLLLGLSLIGLGAWVFRKRRQGGEHA
jgi:protein SCO1/2